MQPLRSELCYIHYVGTETEQQNIPIRIRCSQWRVRDTTMWLSRTSAASSTITANRITKYIDKDQVCTVVSQRRDNVALQGRSYQLVTAGARAHARTHTHTHNKWFCCLFLSQADATFKTCKKYIEHNLNNKQSVPNVDIIQLQTICCNSEIGFRLPQHFNSVSVSPGSHVPPNTTDHTIRYRTVIGRITHYSLSVLHN